MSGRGVKGNSLRASSGAQAITGGSRFACNTTDSSSGSDYGRQRQQRGQRQQDGTGSGSCGRAGGKGGKGSGGGDGRQRGRPQLRMGRRAAGMWGGRD